MPGDVVEILLRTRDEATKQLGAVQKKLQGMQEGLRPIAIASGATFGILTAGAYKSFKAISDLEEVSSKYAVVFRGVEQTVKPALDTLTKGYGFAQKNARAWLSSIQDTLVPMGVTRDRAAGLSGDIVKLGVDLASFNNIPTADTLRDIQSALVGNHETMRKYGVVITETMLKEEAQRQGLADNIEELDNAEKVMLRYQLMVKGSTDAIGDFTRTQDSAANQVRILQERITELWTEMGTALAPTITELIGDVRKWVDSAIEFAQNNKELIALLFKVGTAVTGVTAALAAMGLVLPSVIAGITLLTGPVGLVVAAIAGLTIGFGTLIKKMYEVAPAVPLDELEKLAKKAEEANKQMGPLSEAFGKAAEAIFALTSQAPSMEQFQSLLDAWSKAEPETAEWKELERRIKRIIETHPEFKKYIDDMQAMFAGYEPPETKKVITLDKEQLKTYENLQKQMTQLSQQAEMERSGFAIAAIHREIQARVAAGEEDLDITTNLIYKKLDLAIEARKKQYDFEAEMAKKALEEELERLPEESEERLEIEREYLELKKDQALTFQDEIKQLTLDADAEVENTRKRQDEAKRARIKAQYTEWHQGVVSIGQSLRTSVYGSLNRITDETITIRRFFQGIADIIWKEIVTGLAEMIVKLTIIKALSKIFSFGFFSGGGVTTSSPWAEYMRAQHGLVVGRYGVIPATAGIPAYAQYSPDTVPVLASPGEAFLPAWLTKALTDVLGRSSTTTFEGGGRVSGGAPGWQLHVHGNLYASDQRQIDDLIRQISDAVLDRNLQLHASTAKEVR